MDVRCPQCDTLYEIDARQLRGGAATLKCSQCEHVFRLQTHAALIQENQRRWMVRSATSGDILYFSSFDELHQWILQGKIAKDDDVSRTGKKWTRLGGIGEFMPIFQAVESISSISASHAAEKQAADARASTGSAPQPAPSAPPAASSSPSPSPTAPPQSGPASSSPPASSPTGPQHRSKVPTSRQFGLNETGPQPSPSTRGTGPNPQVTAPPRAEPAPAPTEPPSHRRSQGSSPQPAPPAPSSGGASGHPQVRLQQGAFGGGEPAEEDDAWSFGDAPLGEVERSGQYHSIDYDPGSSSRWPVVLLVVVLVLGGGGAAVYLTRPDLIDQVLNRESKDAVVNLTAKKKKSAPKEAPKKAPGTPPAERVQAAVSSALKAAEKANVDEFSSALAAAQPPVAKGVDDAAEAAKKEAEHPDPDRILSKATHYLESGRPRRARAKFHKVLDLERDNVEAITGLGWSLLAMGSPSAAAAQFEKALSYNSSYGDAYIGLGKAQRDMGNQSAALKAYQDYLSRFPSGPKSSIARYQSQKLKEELGQ